MRLSGFLTVLNRIASALLAVFKGNWLPEANSFPQTAEGRAALRETVQAVTCSATGRFIWLLLFVSMAGGAYGGWLLAHGDNGRGWMFAMAASVTGIVALCYWHRIVRVGMRRRLRDMGLCVTCGYDLTSNVSGTCPECGANVHSSDCPDVMTGKSASQVPVNTSVDHRRVACLICAGAMFLATSILVHWISRYVTWTGDPKTSTLFGVLVIQSIFLWGIAFFVMLVGFVLGAGSYQSYTRQSLSQLAVVTGVYLAGAGLVTFVLSILLGSI